MATDCCETDKPKAIANCNVGMANEFNRQHAGYLVLIYLVSLFKDS